MSPNHQILATLLLALFVDLSYSQTIPDSCLPHDKSVLLRIKKHLGNPKALSSWDPKTNSVGWIGIQCNEQGHVTSVGFGVADQIDIHGQIPPYLDQLPFLTSLSFHKAPNLSGPIPPYIGKLTNLTDLIISGTKVAGPIPEFLGQLTKLDVLYLSSNKFTGPVPNFLGRFKRMASLDLSSNLLTGPIHMAMAQLTNLAYLNFSSNKLSGPIPDFIAQKFKNLNLLDLKFNSLSGPIPKSLGFMPGLATLELTGNQLSGPIPKSLGRSNLTFIYLSQNKLTGDAAFLFEMTSTAAVNVAYNLLRFDFTKVDLSPSLMDFNISHNMIYGSLPKQFGLLRLESIIDVSYNQLCGPIPNGRRYKRVDPIIFAHNKCLCGGPFPGCK